MVWEWSDLASIGSALGGALLSEENTLAPSRHEGGVFPMGGEAGSFNEFGVLLQ